MHFTDRLLFLVARKPVAAGNSVAGGTSCMAAGSSAAAGGAQAAAGGSTPQQQHQGQQQPALTPAQRQQYEDQGFTGPLTVLGPGEAAALQQRYQQYAERLGGAVTGDWRFKSHLLLPWVWDLVHHPTIVAAVSEALGGCRNLLCWSSDWFLKQPGDGGFTGWHQVRGDGGWRQWWWRCAHVGQRWGTVSRAANVLLLSCITPGIQALPGPQRSACPPFHPCRTARMWPSTLLMSSQFGLLSPPPVPPTAAYTSCQGRT